MHRLPFLLLAALGISTAQTVSIQVTQVPRPARSRPIWIWFGYDEPNYTYMKDGKKLLSEFAALSPVPV